MIVKDGSKDNSGTIKAKIKPEGKVKSERWN
jgi:hypothetical protein